MPTGPLRRFNLLSTTSSASGVGNLPGCNQWNVIEDASYDLLDLFPAKRFADAASSGLMRDQGLIRTLRPGVSIKGVKLCAER